MPFSLINARDIPVLFYTYTAGTSSKGEAIEVVSTSSSNGGGGNAPDGGMPPAKPNE